MDVDDHGRGSGLVIVGEGKEAGDRKTVEALDVDQFRFVERFGGHAGRRRVGPPFGRAGFDVDDEDVRVDRIAGRRQRDPLGVGTESHAAGDAARQVGFGERLERGRIGRVELPDGQLGVPLDVFRVDEPAGLVVQRDAVDVPLAVDDGLEVASLEVEIGEIERIRLALVGDEIEPLAVGCPVRALVANVAIVGREMLEITRLQVEHGQVLIEVGVGL